MPHSSTAGRRGRFPASPETQPLGLLNRVNWSEVVWHLFKQGASFVLGDRVVGGKLSEHLYLALLAVPPCFQSKKSPTATWANRALIVIEMVCFQSFVVSVVVPKSWKTDCHAVRAAAVEASVAAKVPALAVVKSLPDR